MTNPELVEWIRTAPGLRLNPDGAFGLQCVDAIDAYGEAIFGVHWTVCVGGVAGAKQLLDVAPDKYWIRFDNRPNDPNWIPIMGDVVVFGGSPANQWGHTAIVESADQNGMWVIQQDGFAPPLIWANGGQYSNKPAHRQWLPYYGPGTGHVTGWLRPREEMIVGYKPPAPAPAPSPDPLPFQRDVPKDARVGFRKEPKVGDNLIKWLEPDHRYDFKGYVDKPEFAVEGNSRWLVGKYTDGFAWSGGFTNTSVDGLENLTEVFFPTPKPEPVPTPDFPHLNGIDISNWQKGIDLSKVPADFVIIKASEGVGWIDPQLAEFVAAARAAGMVVGFYHFARPSQANSWQAELEWFLSCIKPHLQIGDGVYLDWEADDVYRTDWAREFNAGLRAATGARPPIYLNNNAINRTDWTDTQKAIYNWDAVESDFPLWLSYPDATAPKEGYRPAKPKFPVGWLAGFIMWQYTFTGRLPGYAGDLDLNVFYGTRADLLAMGATRLLEDPKPDPEPDPDTKLVLEAHEKLTEYVNRIGQKN